MPSVPRKWTRESVHAAALNFSNRTAFARSNRGAHQAAIRWGWLDYVCSHMNRKGDRKHRYVYEIIDADEKRVYIGLTIDVDARIRQHRCSRYAHIRSMINDYTRVKTSALLPAAAAVALETATIAAYRADGWDVVNKASIGTLGGQAVVWTKDAVLGIARTYNARREFERGHRRAWQAGWRNGWLQEACSHMPRKTTAWTIEMARSEASKFRTRRAFALGSPNAYAICRKRRWMTAVCSHMHVAKNGRISAL